MKSFLYELQPILLSDITDGLQFVKTNSNQILTLAKKILVGMKESITQDLYVGLVVLKLICFE